MHALSQTDVPVPTARALCNDEAVLGTPFYIMDHVKASLNFSKLKMGLQPSLVAMSVLLKDATSALLSILLANSLEASLTILQQVSDAMLGLIHSVCLLQKDFYMIR